MAQAVATPGVCYASTGGITDGGELLNVDLPTGAATLVGSIATPGDLNYKRPGLAINSSGEIFVTDVRDGIDTAGLYRVDAATGAQTLVGTIDVDSVSERWTEGIAFDQNDVLYGLSYDSGDPEGDTPAVFYTIDTTDGTATRVGDTDAGVEFASEFSGLDCFYTDPTITVDIDIRPHSRKNNINLCSRGAVPIAILGSDTFWVNDINTETLRFAEARGKVVGRKDPEHLCRYKDINRDHIQDLGCRFLTADIAALDGESTTATVNGELFDGTPIEGSDNVHIVKNSCH